MNFNSTNIVCVAFPAWNGNYIKSTVQLMKELSKTQRVLYVDYAYTWKDFFNSLMGKGFADWKRMIGLRPQLRKENLENGASLHILTLPPIIPINFLKGQILYDFANAINALPLKWNIKRAIKKLSLESPTVINAFNPTLGINLAHQLGEKKLIYYCYDEISAATWASRHGGRLESEFIKKVDAVIVSSNGLLEKKTRINPNCHLVRNGVDFELFSAHIEQEKKTELLKKFFPNLKKQEKIIGYLGSVDERLDYDLIENLIGSTPEYQYVFVGRITQKIFEQRLSKFPNVVLMGSQQPAHLPTWVSIFDVCLIPFVKNELTAGIYPLKINEYLAAGKPVIATRFADLSEFEDIVYIADTDIDFKEHFSKVFLEPNNVTERKAFAAQNSWESRANDFLEIL